MSKSMSSRVLIVFNNVISISVSSTLTGSSQLRSSKIGNPCARGSDGHRLIVRVPVLLTRARLRRADAGWRSVQTPLLII